MPEPSRDFKAKYVRVDPEVSVFCHLSSTKNNDLILKCSFLSEQLWSSRVAIALGYFSTCSVCHSLEVASCTLLTRKPGGAHVLMPRRRSVDSSGSRVTPTQQKRDVCPKKGWWGGGGRGLSGHMLGDRVKGKHERGASGIQSRPSSSNQLTKGTTSNAATGPESG